MTRLCLELFPIAGPPDAKSFPVRRKKSSMGELRDAVHRMIVDEDDSEFIQMNAVAIRTSGWVQRQERIVAGMTNGRAFPVPSI